MSYRAPAARAACSLHKLCMRQLTERAAGPGGLFRSTQAILNPSKQQQKQSRSRLRKARVAVEDTKLPAELRDDDRKQFDTAEDIRDFVEMRILESMRDGKFDNLKNKGRPLPEQPSTTLEYVMRIMRQNGIRPHWLQLMHDIDREKRQFRTALQHSWHQHMPHAPHRWMLSVRVAEMRAVQINRSVDTFNLVRPACVSHLFRLRLRMHEEVDRAIKSEAPEIEEAKPIPKVEQKEEPRPSWQLFARFVRATDVKEYELPTWGRRRATAGEERSNKGK